MRTRLEGGLVVGLFFVQAALLGQGLRSDGLTSDEVLDIPTGCQQLFTGDYRGNPTHPPLAMMLGAVGLLGLDLKLSERQPGETELAWAHRFVHLENDAGRLLFSARRPFVGLALLLGLVLWAWARSEAGAGGGLVALGFFVFHPSLLAHGHLATTDLAGAFAMTVSAFAFWAWLRRPGWLRAAAFGLALGLAAATRLTAALLIPALAVALLSHWFRTPASERRRRLGHLLSLLAISMTLTIGVIWGAYRFRYDPYPGASVAQPVHPRLALAGATIQWAEDHRLLPEAYLEALRFQLEHNRSGHPSYLLGAHSKTGFRSYFVVAFLVKNTPGFLLAVGLLSITLWRGRWGLSGFEWLCLSAALTVLAGVSLGHIQIGERYLLPAYPFLMLLLASTWRRLESWRFRSHALCLVFVLHAVPSLLALPAGHLAYFNLLAGGSRGGHRVLLDSNLDWGQDLPRLAAWMKREGVRSVQLAYHGADVPDRFGIAHQDLPGLHNYPSQPPSQPFTGVLAVSPNLLFGLVPRLGDPYAALRQRPPDARAGVFFVYRMKTAGPGAP